MISYMIVVLFNNLVLTHMPINDYHDFVALRCDYATIDKLMIKMKN